MVIFRFSGFNDYLEILILLMAVEIYSICHLSAFAHNGQSVHRQSLPLVCSQIGRCHNKMFCGHLFSEQPSMAEHLIFYS